MLFSNSGTLLYYVYLPLSLSPRRLIPIPVQSRTLQHCLCKTKFMLSQQQSAQGKDTEWHIGIKTCFCFKCKCLMMRKDTQRCEVWNVLSAADINAVLRIRWGQLWKQDFLKKVDFKILVKVKQIQTLKKILSSGFLCFSLRRHWYQPLLVSDETFVTMTNSEKSIDHERIEFTHNPILVFSHLLLSVTWAFSLNMFHLS